MAEVNTNLVVVNAPTESKINWTQLIGIVSMLASYFGLGYIVTPEALAALVVVIGAAQALITWVLRTYFTGTKATVKEIKVAANAENLAVVPLIDVKLTVQPEVAAEQDVSLSKL